MTMTIAIYFNWIWYMIWYFMIFRNDLYHEKFYILWLYYRIGLFKCSVHEWTNEWTSNPANTVTCKCVWACLYHKQVQCVKTLLALLQLTQTLGTFHDYNFGLQVLATEFVRRRMRWAGAYREGVQTPPPLKFQRHSKIVSNSTWLWTLLKITEFRMPTPQDFLEKRQ